MTEQKPIKGTESNGDMERLIESLQTYQVELELQNEQLRFIQGELEKERFKLKVLFDYFPIPVVLLNEEGAINNFNVNAAELFNFSEVTLRSHTPFIRVLSKESRSLFYNWLGSYSGAVQKNRFTVTLSDELEGKSLNCFATRLNLDPAINDREFLIAFVVVK